MAGITRSATNSWPALTATQQHLTGQGTSGCTGTPAYMARSRVAAALHSVLPRSARAASRRAPAATAAICPSRTSLLRLPSCSAANRDSRPCDDAWQRSTGSGSSYSDCSVNKLVTAACLMTSAARPAAADLTRTWCFHPSIHKKSCVPCTVRQSCPAPQQLDYQPVLTSTKLECATWTPGPAPASACRTRLTHCPPHPCHRPLQPASLRWRPFRTRLPCPHAQMPHPGPGLCGGV